MRCVLALLAVSVVPLAAIAKGPELPAEPPTDPVLLTVYSARNSAKLPSGGGSAGKPWYGRLWVDDHKVTLILKGQFLTLKLQEGDHSFAGQNGWARESGEKTDISVHGGQRYFVRLTSNSTGVPYVPVHYFAEQVTCREAYDEAAGSEPVKLKHVERSELGKIAREPYFPECGK